MRRRERELGYIVVLGFVGLFVGLFVCRGRGFRFSLRLERNWDGGGGGAGVISE